ncbi:hypothetical protein AB0M94_26830 [Streptomyces xanthochromogenes]|uniref:Lipoprotein n=1 Tax=Streptomyces xanthochromogenes TaxID=67384 RepID=A0ABQ3A347_9ACTN|nr:hypothetical protein [Streptomyces xanthochromogenes]GGY31528.1 hypothetical protein GCM10010326_26620 [Streptomyces xanthochromogenes]
MSKSVKRAGISLAAVGVLVAATAGCQSDGDSKKAAEAPKKAAQQSSPKDARTALQAAYKKTSAAKSAKVTLKMSMPAGATGAAGAGAAGGDLVMSGVQSWDPAAMDMTMSGSAFAQAGKDAPDKIRMVQLDNVMYMDMGTTVSQHMDGKHWMKMDLGALASAAGGGASSQSLTGGAEKQDPAQQLAILTDSPSLKHLGSEQIDGAPAEHYKGTLTVDEMAASNQALDGMSAQDRKKLLDSAKQSGIKGYDTELWINKDGYPVQMNVGITTPQGRIGMNAHYSDYGTKVAVTAPPASETFDMAEMMKRAGAGAGTGENA